MSVFEMVKYHSQSYPDDIPLRIEECAAHFDTTAVRSELKQSLHTEYSYGRRKFDSDLIRQFPTVASAQKDGVPQLWKDEQWAAEFAQFVISLAKEQTLEVIEVHPPFNDYTDWDTFISSYKVFEDNILARYPSVSVLIENRCGSLYRGGRFLVSKMQDVETLCEKIEQNKLNLKIALDLPQIYTAHNVKKQDQYLELLERAEAVRKCIGGAHLWGKKVTETGRRVAHCGDLTSYFEGDLNTKELFLQQFNKTFDDGVCRKMVLEVNSGNEDLISIINDLRQFWISFL